jgi:hypothetical protein
MLLNNYASCHILNRDGHPGNKMHKKEYGEKNDANE